MSDEKPGAHVSFEAERSVETTHGQISLYDVEGPGIPVVMIHANSVSKASFAPQLQALSGSRRLLAFDLPGHGSSGNAIDPRRTYSITGYAQAILEALRHLEVEEFVVLGHSLGGHIALEMIALGAPVRGAFVFGTPPIDNSLAGLQAGFQPSPEMAYTGNAEISDDQIKMVLHLALGADARKDTHLIAAVRRTDGLARQYMIEAVVAGQGSDQRALVETSCVPVAIVNGNQDPVINLDYIDGIAFANIWRGQPIRIEGAGHGLHREKAGQFNRLFDSFLADVSP